MGMKKHRQKIVYRTWIISTIVDFISSFTYLHVYRTWIISTIVDKPKLDSEGNGL